MSERINEVIRRYEALRAKKSEWNQLHDDLARVQLPRRVGFATEVTPGERRTDDIYDGTPLQAARGLANATGGMLRPNGRSVLSMSTDNDQLDNLGEVKDWLAKSTDNLHDAKMHPRARYLQATGEVDQDLAVLGTGVIFSGESKTRNNLLFQSQHLKDAVPFFDEEDNAEGMFFKVMRPLRLVAREFGEERLSETSRERLKRSPDEKIALLRAVLPRDGGRPDALFARNLPWMDLWIELDAKRQLSEGGFHEFPFAVPRWDTSSGEDMGRSPGMIALPDSDTLQAMGETILIAGQRAADPPLAVPNDGVFSAANMFPGGLTYYDIETAEHVGGNPVFPVVSGMNLPLTRDMQDDVRSQIWAAFYRNILNLPIDGPQMTATEVIQRKQEFLREIGPVFGRLESDYTAPVDERAFMILLRAGALPPIPRALQGRNIIFEYESPVRRISKQIDAAAARLWAAEVIELGQVKPAAIDWVDEDGLAKFSAEALALPREVIRSDDEVNEIRRARQEALQMQQQAEGIQEAVATVKTGTEAAKIATETAQMQPEEVAA